MPKRLSEQNQGIATVLAFIIVPLSGLATDIYLPSMPHMAVALHTAESSMQLTISLFLISYGLSQIIAGSFLDAFGRRRIGLVSLLVFSLSCFIIPLSGHIAVIYAMRVVQGICTGFIIVAKRAFFVDLYEGERQKRYLSTMTIVWSVGPIVAPFIGGYLEQAFNWQASFYLLGAYCLLMAILELIFSGETIRKNAALNLRKIASAYAGMLRAGDFIFGLLMLGISYAMIMLFSLSGPFIIEHQMGYSVVTAGYSSLILGFAWMCGGFIGKAMLNKSFYPKLRRANYIQLALIILMIVTASWQTNILTLIGFAFFIHVTAGFIFNNYFTYCLSRFPDAAGIAGGLTGGLAYSLTSVLSYGVAYIFKAGSQSMLGYGYLCMGILGFSVISLGGKRLHS